MDEYKTQLKAALLDMRGKDCASVKFSFSDLMIQFRLSALEQDIRELVRGQ